MRRFLRWTRKNGEAKNILISSPDKVNEDYSVVEVFTSQNRIRHALSVLDQLKFGGFSALPNLWDVMLTYDPNRHEYRLWVYTRNWKGQESFLAGCLVGQQHKWRAIERRNRRKKRMTV